MEEYKHREWHSPIYDLIRWLLTDWWKKQRTSKLGIVNSDSDVNEVNWDCLTYLALCICHFIYPPMQLQAKECQGMTATTRNKKRQGRILPRTIKRTWPWQHPDCGRTPGFWNCARIIFCCFKLIQQSSKAAYEKMLILRKQILVETEEVTLVITQWVLDLGFKIRFIWYWTHSLSIILVRAFVSSLAGKRLAMCGSSSSGR